MPKTPSSRSRVTRSSLSKPYARRSKSDVEDTAGSGIEKARLISQEEKNAWEATRCCICLENPHNAVLLVCPNSQKGCMPYVCDTSARHSNCLDTYKRTAMEEVEGKEGELRLPCPLCRGSVTGQKVNKGARHYWNQKERPCAKESCNFYAKYHALRVHARTEHPDDRPTEVAPDRAQKWQRAEREREMQDVLSAALSGPNGEPPSIQPDARGWTVYFLFHMLDGELGGFSVGRRFVVGAGPGRRAASTGARRYQWGIMDDAEGEAETGDEGGHSPEQQPAAQPTHNYFTRSRQEAPREPQPTEGPEAGNAEEQLQDEEQGMDEPQPVHRTRSVGLGNVVQPRVPEVELVSEGGAVGGTGGPLSWRGISGSGSVGGRRLQRLGRIRLTGAGNENPTGQSGRSQPLQVLTDWADHQEAEVRENRAEEASDEVDIR